MSYIRHHNIVMVAVSCLAAGTPHSRSVILPPQVERERKIQEKAHGSNSAQGDHPACIVMGKTGSAWGN